MQDIALKIRIHGKVQGVWYRDWAVQTATALGVDGWVRNRADGTVEALLVGEEQAVRELINRCHNGPEKAVIERIEEAPAQGIAPRGAFERKPTV